MNNYFVLGVRINLAYNISIIGGGGGLITKSCLTLATPWSLACWAPLSMEFSRQEYDTGCLGLVHWDYPEGWYGEGGGFRMGNTCIPVVDSC